MIHLNFGIASGGTAGTRYKQASVACQSSPSLFFEVVGVRVLPLHNFCRDVYGWTWHVKSTYGTC